MAWDEWEQLKSEAARKHDTHMRLNQLPDSPGGSAEPGGDLKVGFKDLAAIGDDAFKLWDHLGKDGKHADASTTKAAGDLKAQGFKLGPALDTTQRQWASQLKTLLDACAQISNHMDFTEKAHKGDEHYIYGQLSSISTLDKGFDERTRP
ncbi:hypothetical protein [Streptomyces odontomachi]|uniref:hypothetical protein n=1 Tax=Streptomyces odontomachi TaxID=2944940 RepID=UPI002109B6B4|nr:hypothetical protein [Streptomyces sp. ODS25]